MSGSTNGRVLRIAIAGSLAVHLIVATLVHPHKVQAAPEQKPTNTTIIHLIPPPAPKPTPPPPPKPAQPHPRPAQHQSSAHRPAMHVPRARSSNPLSPPGVAIATEAPGPPDTGTVPPDSGPTDGPIVPTPTPKPACSAPDVAARAVTVQSPNTPDDMQGTNATAKIRVDLDAQGGVLGVSVYESAGSMELDRAALQAARASRYAPEEKDCKKIPGSYLFTVDFATM